MPYSIRKQECEQADGTPGNWVVLKMPDGDYVSCHRTRNKAREAIRAREAAEKRLDYKQAGWEDTMADEKYRAGEPVRIATDFTTRVVNEKERIVRYVGSTESTDRYKTRLKGWELKAYSQNPVFLWAHNYDHPPIGRAINITIDKKKRLLFDVQYVPREILPFAGTVYDMVKEGYMKAVSVGFVPGKVSYNEEDKVHDLEQNELLELSQVPVPANPEALVNAFSRGVVPEAHRDLFVLNADGPQSVDGMSLTEAREAVEAWISEQREVYVDKGDEIVGIEETEDGYRIEFASHEDEEEREVEEGDDAEEGKLLDPTTWTPAEDATNSTGGIEDEAVTTASAPEARSEDSEQSLISSDDETAPDVPDDEDMPPMLDVPPGFPEPGAPGVDVIAREDLEAFIEDVKTSLDYKPSDLKEGELSTLDELLLHVKAAVRFAQEYAGILEAMTQVGSKVGLDGDAVAKNPAAAADGICAALESDMAGAYDRNLLTIAAETLESALSQLQKLLGGTTETTEPESPPVATEESKGDDAWLRKVETALKRVVAKTAAPTDAILEQLAARVEGLVTALEDSGRDTDARTIREARRQMDAKSLYDETLSRATDRMDRLVAKGRT